MVRVKIDIPLVAVGSLIWIKIMIRKHLQTIWMEYGCKDYRFDLSAFVLIQIFCILMRLGAWCKAILIVDKLHFRKSRNENKFIKVEHNPSLKTIFV